MVAMHLRDLGTIFLVVASTPAKAHTQSTPDVGATAFMRRVETCLGGHVKTGQS